MNILSKSRSVGIEERVTYLRFTFMTVLSYIKISWSSASRARIPRVPYLISSKMHKISNSFLFLVDIRIE